MKLGCWLMRKSSIRRVFYGGSEQNCIGTAETRLSFKSRGNRLEHVALHNKGIALQTTREIGTKLKPHSKKKIPAMTFGGLVLIAAVPTGAIQYSYRLHTSKPSQIPSKKKFKIIWLFVALCLHVQHWKGFCLLFYNRNEQKTLKISHSLWVQCLRHCNATLNNSLDHNQRLIIFFSSNPVTTNRQYPRGRLSSSQITVAD